MKLFQWIGLMLMGIGALDALEITRVILATNQNPNYVQFWPVVAPIWKKMGFQPTLALIADEYGDLDTSLGDVLLFSVLSDVPESMQAQAIRLLVPCLYPDEGCLIADIDMLPISSEYLRSGAVHCPDHAFLVYRDGAYWNEEMYRWPMCYVAAKGRVFQEIFGINRVDEIADLLRYWHSQGLGWNTDECMMYAYVMAWEFMRGKVVRLGHGVPGRLDRGNWTGEYQAIDLAGYIDCHCPRPYATYKESIDQVVQAIYRLHGWVNT